MRAGESIEQVERPSAAEGPPGDAVVLAVEVLGVGLAVKLSQHVLPFQRGGTIPFCGRRRARRRADGFDRVPRAFRFLEPVVLVKLWHVSGNLNRREGVLTVRSRDAVTTCGWRPRVHPFSASGVDGSSVGHVSNLPVMNGTRGRAAG